MTTGYEASCYGCDWLVQVDESWQAVALARSHEHRNGTGHRGTAKGA